jgi:glutaconate CoA-transferase subunit B
MPASGRKSNGDRAANSSEFLIATLARRLPEAGHFVAGAISPIPAAAVLLAEHLSAGRVSATVLGSTDHFRFSDGGRELFDAAGRGRVHAFFLSGGQIDGQANINLVGTGSYPDSDTRFPGSFGSGYLYYVVPNVILFREEHSKRVLVSEVDFVSAPGISPPDVYRPGGPTALVTGRAVFAFNRDAGRFCLESVHPGSSLADIVENTGFDFDHADPVPATPDPDAEILALIRGPVRDLVSRTYPEFANTLDGNNLTGC